LAGKGVEVVAFDWLGHGDSEKIDEWDIYAFEELYTDLLTIFETFSRKEAKNIVIGHSIGSAMSVFLTSRTQKVDGLVLLATNHQMPSGIGLPIWYAPAWLLSASRPILSRGFADKAWHVTTDRKLVEEEAIKAENNSISIAKAVYRQMKWPTEQDFKSISIPTVIVAGETDGITPGENSKIVHSWIETSSSHVEFHTLPNTSHNLMLEKPEEVNKLIDGLIYKLLADKK
jgi:abhydrolase domain-containing protein 8